MAGEPKVYSSSSYLPPDSSSSAGYEGACDWSMTDGTITNDFGYTGFFTLFNGDPTAIEVLTIEFSDPGVACSPDAPLFIPADGSIEIHCTGSFPLYSVSFTVTTRFCGSLTLAFQPPP